MDYKNEFNNHSRAGERAQRSSKATQRTPTRSIRTALVLLLLASVMMVVPVSAALAAPTTTSTLTLNTQALNGTKITGLYSELLNSAGKVAAKGYSPKAYTLTDGATYTVEADGYGSCSFDHWADTGSASYIRTISISSNTQITAVYNCGGSSGGSASVTVKATDTNNNVLTGYFVQILNPSGNVVATGYTPQTFSNLVAGASYSVQVDGYQSCSFAHWSNGATSDPMTFTATTSATFTALLKCNTGGGETGNGPGTITIYDHRIPAGYWADCFALTCSNPLDPSCGDSCTGAGASMWVVLYNAAGTVVASGFADENGLVFYNLTAGATYYIYSSDCDLCHGSTHDVLFHNWGPGTGTNDIRPLPVIANGTYVDAWYTCTNGCSGD
jgi:hypothetical protein